MLGDATHDPMIAIRAPRATHPQPHPLREGSRRALSPLQQPSKIGFRLIYSPVMDQAALTSHPLPTRAACASPTGRGPVAFMARRCRASVAPVSPTRRAPVAPLSRWGRFANASRALAAQKTLQRCELRSSRPEPRHRRAKKSCPHVTSARPISSCQQTPSERTAS